MVGRRKGKFVDREEKRSGGRKRKAVRAERVGGGRGRGRAEREVDGKVVGRRRWEDC